MKVMIITGNVPCIHLFVLRTQSGRSALWIILRCMRNSVWAKNEKTLYLMHFGNVGHLVAIGVNVGLLLYWLCVGRALMMSSAVFLWHVGGWAWQGRIEGLGKCQRDPENPRMRTKKATCKKSRWQWKHHLVGKLFPIAIPKYVMSLLKSFIDDMCVLCFTFTKMHRYELIRVCICGGTVARW